MRIAHFLHRYPPALGGAESYARRLTRFYEAHGDHVTVFTSTADDLGAMWHAGLHEFPEQLTGPVRRFKPLHFPARRYVLKALSLIPHAPLQARALPCNPVCPGMRRVLDADTMPYDVVHAFAFPYTYPCVMALRLARRRNAAFALTPFLHLGDLADDRNRTRRQYTSRPLRWLLRQADVVFCQTAAEADAVAGLGVPRGRVVLQGLGAEPGECTGGDRRAARARWNVGDDDVAVGMLANHSPAKGTPDLLAATGMMRTPARVVLAGPAMAGALPAELPGPVTYLGALTEAEKRDFFAGIDVLALPSRTDSFGLVLPEAWANGLPVVVYNAGGPGSLVRDQIDGLVVPCGDVAGLAAALDRLAGDAATRARMGAAGRVRLATEFDWPARLAVVRNRLLAEAGSRRPGDLP